MIEVELTDPHLVTVGYTGEPGQRTFFVQAEDETQQVTLLLEKEQVAGIAELIAQLLARIDDTPATDWDRTAMDLRPPVEPRWRVGDISVGLDPEAERFVLEFGELPVDVDTEEVEDVAEDVAEDVREVRIWADHDQARRLAAHALEIVGQGRPTCQLCGRPLEGDGDHVCPATNGHGRLTR